LKENDEGPFDTAQGGEELSITPPLSLGITPERVAGISDAVLRNLNARNISSL